MWAGPLPSGNRGAESKGKGKNARQKKAARLHLGGSTKDGLHGTVVIRMNGDFWSRWTVSSLGEVFAPSPLCVSLWNVIVPLEMMGPQRANRCLVDKHLWGTDCVQGSICEDCKG